MNEEAILERVKKVVEEKLVVDEEEIDLSSDFIEDLGADSLDIPDLVMAFEEEFDIEIPDEVVEKIKTVGDVVKIIKEKLG